MAALGAMYPTLLDVAKRLDPDGAIPVIAEMMTKVNPIMDDIPYYEGNLQTGHLGIVRTGLPTVAWRLLNYGTAPSKSKTKQVTDTCGILKAWTEIDKELFNLNGAKEAFRQSEDVAGMEAMGQEVATTLFYGNTQTDPEKFLGLSARFSSTTAENGGQIIKAAGAGADNTSIWMIAWGERTIHGIYPKGTQAGLMFENHGEETKEDANGLLMRVLRSEMTHKVGIHMKDWQAVVRICNLDASEIIADYTWADLVELMIQAWYKIPLRLRSTGRLAFYCNPTIKEALVKLAVLNKVSNSTLSVQQMETGEPMVRFWGVPVRECDSITNAEDLVS